jgi:hypothetical protein
MTDKSPKSDRGADSPYPLPGFETDLISEIKCLAAQLPTGTARIQVSRVPGHPEWLEPYFEIIPANSKAARIKGGAIKTDLNLTIGETAWREFVGFARGGTVVKGFSWQEELRGIWQAVVKGGFTENIYRDSKGKAIGWATRLSLGHTDLIIRNGRTAERLLGPKRVERITYEPYFK